MRLPFQGFLLLLILLSPFSAGAETELPVVESQEISVTLAPEKHLLTGVSGIVLAAGVRRASFAMASTAVVDSVSVAGVKPPFAFADGLLTVEIPPNAGGEQVVVSIAYHALFNDPVPERPANNEDPGYGVTGSITPRGVFLGSDAHWYPVPPSTPRRRSIRISAPAGIEAVTNGQLTARATDGGVTTSTWEEKRPVGILSLSAGPYQIRELVAAGTHIYTYFYPESAGLAQRFLDAAAGYLSFYAERFGPYPFEKFAIVENFFPTGYGYPSYTLLGSAVIRLPFIIDTSLPHEIAHNWWGNGVLVDYREGNWSEGLVTYLADYLLEERKSSASGKDYRLRLLTDYSDLVLPDRDFPPASFTSRVDPASRAVGYGKVAMLFHMVRSQMGEQAFFNALRELSRERLYQTATWSDIVRIFSRNAGRDLAPFVKQWLVRPGVPQLVLQEVNLRQEGKKWVITGIVKQTPPHYEVPVPLRVESANGSADQTVQVSGERTPFSFVVSAYPRRLLLDPDFEIFRLIPHAELPPTVNRVKGAEQLLLVATGNCRAGDATLRVLLESMGHGKAKVIAERKLDARTISSHDLLFCGVPQNAPNMPPLPAGVTVAADRYAIAGESYSAPDGLLFLALPHPLNKERVAALFIPLSEKAADQYARKITHYGRYSYLGFAGGVNRQKGVFPLLGGGSVVEFSSGSSNSGK